MAHAPFLDYEINCVKPKIIVTVGTTALTRLLDNRYEISNVHGKIIENTPILELNDKKMVIFGLKKSISLYRNTIPQLFL